MLKKILVALDGSQNAERALPWVKQYAGREHSEVALLRAVDTEYLEKEWIPIELKEAQDYLLRIERELNFAGIPCKMMVRQGKPAPAIVKTAIDENADLILMTTRGGSKIQRWVMGGVTEQVLRLSPLPVLAVRSRTAMPRQGRVRRILVPVDGSKLAEDALPWAEKLAHFLKARLVLLHVYPALPRALSRRNEENFDALRKRMLYTVARLKEKGVKAIFRVRQGDAAEKILRHADRCDLILTTTHGFGGFKRWIFGSVAEKLIHNAEIPVIVYKTPRQVKVKALKQVV